MKKIVKLEKLPSPYSMFTLMIKKTKFENILSTPDIRVIFENLMIELTRVKRYNDFFNLSPKDKVSITFPFIETIPLQLYLFSIPEITINPVGFLHVSNYMKKYREIPIGKPLIAEAFLNQVVLAKKGIEISVVQNIYFENEIIWSCVSKYLKLSKKYRLKEENSKEKKSIFTPIEKYQKQVDFTVSSKDAKKYASLSGDFNPIHISKFFAKLVGLPSPIIHGMWTVGKCLQHLSYTQLEKTYFYHIFKGTIPIGAKGKIMVHSIDHGEQVEVYIEDNPKPCFQGIISDIDINID